MNVVHNCLSDSLTIGFDIARMNHVCAIYALTFIVVLPILFRNSPHSLYFVGWSRKRLTEKAIDANELRLKDATRYLNGLDVNKTRAFHGALQQQKAVDLTLAVVTVKRTGGYLTQVITELDKIFKRDANFKKVMFICNTFAGPGSHEEAEALARYFPMEVRFPRGSNEHSINDNFEKEKRDYVYCLQKALQFPTNHVVIIEDDAVPRRDLLDVLKYVFQNRVENIHTSGDKVVHQWAYVKLFYPDRWLGYARVFLHIMELLSIGGVGGSLYLLAVMLFFPSHGLSRLQMKYKTFLSGALYCVLVAVAIGRQNVHAVQRLSSCFYTVWAGPDCCTPAVLFSAEAAIDIGSYLAGITCNRRLPLDLAMSKYAHARGFTTLLVQPNLFRNVGLISTLKGISNVPEQFAFLQ